MIYIWYFNNVMEDYFNNVMQGVALIRERKKYGKKISGGLEGKAAGKKANACKFRGLDQNKKGNKETVSSR